MGLLKIAKVAVSKISYSADCLYSYLVPENLSNLKVGQVAVVPFGSSRKNRLGIIYGLEEKEKNELETNSLKVISEILYKDFFIKEEILELSKFMKSRYFCTFFDAIKTMVPITKIFSGPNFLYRLCSNLDTKIKDFVNLSEDIKLIINYMQKKPKGVGLATLEKHFGKNSESNIECLLKAGLILKEFNKEKIKCKSETVALNDFIDKKELKKLTENQKLVFSLLKKREVLNVKEILYLTGVNRVSVNSLVKKGILKFCEEENNESLNFNEKIKLEKKDIILNEEQNKAFSGIYKLYKEKKYNVSLLFGITGSGKTSVYMKLIDEALKKNEGVIVLLPEITLTSQVINKFYSRYGKKVAVYHSALKEREKISQYKKVERGECSIVVGTRSAVFLPVKNLRLIVIDEEQEDSYKSESTPRYNTKEIAQYKCYFSNSLLLLSSATPSLESFYFAKTGKYNLSTLKNRYGDAKLPEVKIVDMAKELKNGNTTCFSSCLLEELKNSLSNNKQSILLINRRGHDTFLICRNCGKVLFCPRCSVSLVYHSKNKRLVCHRCNYSTNNINVCPSCGSKEIKYSGFGTQKIEEDLKILLPEAKILRMDSDVTFSKEIYETKLKDFKEKKYNIMVGTQMVAKGLDFKDVTLVAILCADQSLYSSDFRGFERSFSLFTQVIGRAGRANERGRALIQTFTPESPVINLAAKQDYLAFFKTEIKLRNILKYPPFVNLCLIIFKGKSSEKVKSVALAFFSFLKKLALEHYKNLFMQVLAPCEASIFKLKDNYRYKIIIKYKNKKIFLLFFEDLLNRFYKENNTGGVSIFVDTSPNNII